MKKETVDWGANGEIAAFNMMVWAGIIEKGTLEQRLGECEGASHADIWGGVQG